MAALDFLETPARQASIVEETAHRRWPLPTGPWVMGQTWDDLLFVHYPVRATTLRDLIPVGLEVEEHSGSAWLGVTPFAITGLRLEACRKTRSPGGSHPRGSTERQKE